jgi:hypothetical protein
MTHLHELHGRVPDVIIAFGRTVLFFRSFFVFALAVRETKNKMGKYYAAAGKYQLEADHRVTRVNI